MIASQVALEIILRARDEASRVVEQSNRAFNVLQGAVAGLVSGGLNIAYDAAIGVARGAAQAGKALWDMASNAAPIQGISAAFRGVATDASATLEILRQGALGMVSDADLMQTYNKAAQMISKSFADDLPNAMGYLSKVSASTGTDLGYLLDSLTVGVARLSPQILDNLNIQVNATEANEAYAKAIGKNVSELTKQEQQTAMMNQVMEKLAINTASLPDVTGNAATGMQQLQTTFQNVKDQVGVALIPILIALLTPLGELATEYGPRVAVWFGLLVPLLAQGAEGFGVLMGFVDQVIGALDSFIWMLSVGVEPIDAIRTALSAAFGPEVGNAVANFLTGIEPILETLKAVFAEVWGFIQSVVASFVAWFQANLPLIQETGQTLADFFQNHIAPALDNAWNIIKTVVQTAIVIIQSVITAAMQVINGDWTAAWETIKTLAATVWEAIKTIVTEFMEGILNAIGSNLDQFKATWSANWEMAKTIVSTVWSNIQEAIEGKINEILVSVRTWLGDVKAAIGGFSLRDVGESLMNGLRDGIVSRAASLASAAMDAVRGAINVAKSLLGIRSPSRVFMDIGKDALMGFELAFTRYGDGPVAAVRAQVSDMINVMSGLTDAQHRYVLAPSPALLPALGRPTGGGMIINLRIENCFGADSVRTDDDIERIAQRQREMLELRGIRSWEI